MIKRAVLIVGHGSRLRNFQKPLERLARGLSADKKFSAVHCCYLDITAPSIPDAVERCIREGAQEILVLPYFLLMGNHVKSDIPRLVKEAQNKYRGRIKIKLCPYLGYDKKILSLVKCRLKETQ